MDKELLVLYGARHAVLKMLEKGYCEYVIKRDGIYKSIEYMEIQGYITKRIIELEKKGDMNEKD